ncbi:hypothetical protein Syun_019648 [Stephania yunnanensis]|uniref:DCD domain-containing protein n=1 Tax=Stephania yunnanensis TaxID=152371 RepID=A0AAP0IUH6_9MAGN
MDLNNNNNQSFWQFSDQLRLQSSNFGNLSLNDPIWSSSFATKRPEERRNFDIRVGGDRSSSSLSSSVTNLPPKGSDLNGYFNDGWKIGGGFESRGADLNGFDANWKVGLNNEWKIGKNLVGNKGYGGLKSGNTKNNNKKNKSLEDQESKTGKKGNNSNSYSSKDGNNNNKSSTDKRFKTLPPSESLPRNETVGGYIFVCNNDTMEENLKRQLFGLPPRYRDSVRAITPGLPLFLYNYSTHQLHGIFEAASFGGTNIDPTAWEDKKTPGESRFPAQVQVVTRKICEPLEEDSFRPVLHHYDGPKFRLELNVPEALSLLDIFESN